MKRYNKKIVDYLNDIADYLRKKGIKYKINYKDIALSPLFFKESNKYKRIMEETISQILGKEFKIEEAEKNQQKFCSSSMPIMTLNSMNEYDMEVHEVDFNGIIVDFALAIKSNGNMSLTRKFPKKELNYISYQTNMDALENFILNFCVESDKYSIQTNGNNIIYRYNDIIINIDLITGNKRVVVNSQNRNFPAFLECTLDKNNTLINGSVSLKVKNKRKINGKYKFIFDEGRISAKGFIGKDNERSVDLFKETDLLKVFYMYYIDEFITKDDLSFKIINGLIQTVFDGFSDDYRVNYKNVRFNFVSEIESFISAHMNEIKKYLILPEFKDATDKFMGSQMARKKDNKVFQIQPIKEDN